MECSKKVLAIIPARGGSKGIPRKNIKDLNGKPLIAYTIEAAKGSEYIDRVVVSTEDSEIARISNEFGAEVPCLRSQELATDASPTIDSVLHMLVHLKEYEGYEPDYICLLQCTSPLRNSKDIDGAMKKLFKANVDGIVSVCEAEVNPYWTHIFKGDKLEYFLEEGRDISIRQRLPKVYRINGAIYIIKINALLSQKTLEPQNITGYIMSNENSIDIDNNLDFMLSELIIKNKDEGV
jgi:N-acylneuraminate cytidylyltransferase/CMP-N,N'-diacetyllegionaminic acid synthase